MDVLNHTPFPAQAFQAVDQYEQEFHVFVLRQTLSFAAGGLEYADEQAPLCDTDAFFDAAMAGSVRQESDYCPYKPRCDVIVNATAYAPKGKPVKQFNIRLRVTDSKTQRRLVDKTLSVCGERQFKKKLWIVRAILWAIKWGTLALIRPSPWKLTRPKPFTSLPVRYEAAYGGQCRIDAVDPFAKYVLEKERLTAAQLAEHSAVAAEPGKQAVAHATYEANPVGLGFMQSWYLKATKEDIVAAPRIELLGAAMTAKQFWRWLKTSPDVQPAGLGVRDRTHPDRRAMIGDLDEAFVKGSAPLPIEFDFGIWNAAPPDQQIDFPCGDEVYELANMCPAGTPGALFDNNGHTYLQLSRPPHECFMLVHRTHGAIGFHPLAIDTVLIEPDKKTFTLVWRLVLPKEDSNPIEISEFRMRTFSDRDRLRYDVAVWYELANGHDASWPVQKEAIA